MEATTHMARLTRAESQMLTRAKLVRAAFALFGKCGYRATTVDKIAEASDLTKGAFYANFLSKEEIFGVCLEHYSAEHLDPLYDNLAAAASSNEIIDVVSGWFSDAAMRANWSYLVLDYLNEHGTERRSIDVGRHFRVQWRRLGKVLLKYARDKSVEPEMLGAIVFELAHAPALAIMKKSLARKLIRTTLSALLVD